MNTFKITVSSVNELKIIEESLFKIKYPFEISGSIEVLELNETFFYETIMYDNCLVLITK